MTRKDYQLIADVIRKRRTDRPRSVNAIQALNDVAAEMARALEADNPNFDDIRFFTACGFYD